MGAKMQSRGVRSSGADRGQGTTGTERHSCAFQGARRKDFTLFHLEEMIFEGIGMFNQT